MTAGNQHVTIVVSSEVASVVILGLNCQQMRLTEIEGRPGTSNGHSSSHCISEIRVGNWVRQIMMIAAVQMYGFFILIRVSLPVKMECY